MERQFTAVLIVPVIVVLALSTGFRSAAQEPASKGARHLKAPGQITVTDDSQPVPDKDIELLRKDLRSQKKKIVAANMDFTDAEAEKFWPVYDRYAADLAKIYDSKLALIGDYLENYK